MVLHKPKVPLQIQETNASKLFLAATPEINLAALRRIFIAREGDEKTHGQYLDDCKIGR